MNLSDFKFTFYDIVSYTFCGAISIIILNVTMEVKEVTLPDTNLAKYLIELISLESVFSFIIVSYFLGKIVSTLSSIIFEKLILGWMFEKLYKITNIKYHISEILYTSFNNKFSNLYNSDYDEKDWRILITYAEENRPSTYSTAFIFLVYYGMARNLMLVFLMSALFLVSTHLLLAAIMFALFLVESYEYHRFRKYYHQQIIYAFINDKEGG